MATDYDKAQDQRISENAAAIRELTEYMRQIRNFHMPWAVSEKRTRFRNKFVTPFLKISAAVTVGMSLYKGIAVYLEKMKLHKMADQYAYVATELYERENNPEVALPFIEKAIAIYRDTPEYLFQRAYMQGMAATRELLNLKRPFTKAELDAAHRSYAEALYLNKIEPQRAEPFILQGQILSALKDKERARAAIEKAVALAPDNAFAHIRMAMIHLDYNDVSNAVKSLDHALQLDPNAKWAWLWKGVVASDYTKDVEETRRCCDKALEIDPKFDMAYYNRGWTYASDKVKRYDLAREEMRKALAVNPDYKEACYAIGMFYGYEDNYSIAKVWMDKAIALDENFLSAHKWRGIICGEMGHFTDAIKSFDAAIMLDPMNADLYVRRARMEDKLGKDDDALRDLRFAYELSPKAKRTLLYPGDVYLKVGDSSKAIEYYDQALALDAEYDDAYARKANALAVADRIDDALLAMDQAIKMAKYKPQRFWIQKAAISEKAGRLDDALTCYVRARTLDGKLAEAWRKEAELLKRKGSKASKDALRKYVELVPTDTEARKELNN
ncbi:MAG: tetratricopeptide repeat protein [Kiritimatiellae bacterium]|nr:tetratricopeptide repeat protein [Kiritimatiellia bacterium]